MSKMPACLFSKGMIYASVAEGHCQNWKKVAHDKYVNACYSFGDVVWPNAVRKTLSIDNVRSGKVPRQLEQGTERGNEDDGAINQRPLDLHLHMKHVMKPIAAYNN